MADEHVELSDLGDVLARTSEPFEQRRVASLANKRMPCRATLNDGDLATNLTVEKQPASGAYVGIAIGGWLVPLIGDGTTSGCMAYFSGDGGLTARPWGQVQRLDTVHWNHTVAGAQLADTDVMDLLYEEGMAV